MIVTGELLELDGPVTVTCDNMGGSVGGEGVNATGTPLRWCRGYGAITCGTGDNKKCTGTSITLQEGQCLPDNQE